MREEIQTLQQEMKQQHIDLYFIPPSDPHNSEFTHAFFHSIAFLSGFTGESAWMLISQEDAWLWTDGRFFLQAEQQLADSGITLMKIGEKGVPTVLGLLRSLVRKRRRMTLAYDGRTVSAKIAGVWDQQLSPMGVTIKKNVDLISAVWTDRPELNSSALFRIPSASSGMPSARKRRRIMSEMVETGADWLLLSDLTEIAWYTNLRGADIPCTPVFYAYLLISTDPDQLDQLFLLPGAELSDDHNNAKEPADNLGFIRRRNYSEIEQTLRSIPPDQIIWMDTDKVNESVFSAASERHMIIDQPTPVYTMKAIKNDIEIASEKETMIYDGCAMVEFIHWLKTTVSGHRITEMDAADYLKRRRLEKPGCFDLSFPTVSAYGSNAAIVHYMPSPDTDTVLRPEGFLLVDSGGQYITGTTDITRTIALGELTQEMKDVYTRVLKSHIALATAHLGPSDSTCSLDQTSRAPLREAGLDFNHSISHGIGHVLSVHEGPNIIDPKTECPLISGMIQSDEPGVYLEGKFGVRIENELLCRAETVSDRYFETLTLCPYERSAINTDLLTQEELDWINAYHRRVEDALLPHLHKEDRKFLQVMTAPL
jgi:Xaa-Pro aminopeptidase